MCGRYRCNTARATPARRRATMDFNIFFIPLEIRNSKTTWHRNEDTYYIRISNGIHTGVVVAKPRSGGTA